MDNKKINISGLFQGLQVQMEAYLNTNRQFLEHPGTKGDSLEDIWIKWLREYLPNRYNVDKAIIIDSEGHLSQQIDLVIYDQQYTPFVFNQNGALYIPAEGVYAVFEVKPDLNGRIQKKGHSISYIKYAGQKIESVRKLQRTTTNIIDRGVSKSPRPLTKIIGGILTSVSTFSKQDTILNHLCSLKDLETIDMGCSIEYGSFYVDYEGKEDTSIIDFNNRIVQYYEQRKLKSLYFSPRNQSLITFFLQLSRYLQQGIGTVAAIDFNAYAKTIGVSIDMEI